MEETKCIQIKATEILNSRDEGKKPELSRQM